METVIPILMLGTLQPPPHCHTSLPHLTDAPHRYTSQIHLADTPHRYLTDTPHRYTSQMHLTDTPHRYTSQIHLITMLPQTERAQVHNKVHNRYVHKKVHNKAVVHNKVHNKYVHNKYVHIKNVHNKAVVHNKVYKRAQVHNKAVRQNFKSADSQPHLFGIMQNNEAKVHNCDLPPLSACQSLFWRPATSHDQPSVPAISPVLQLGRQMLLGRCYNIKCVPCGDQAWGPEQGPEFKSHGLRRCHAHRAQNSDCMVYVVAMIPYTAASASHGF